jgi:lipopolysaccharide biosynthesis glycosyltransferase
MTGSISSPERRSDAELSELHIACSADANYVPHSAAMIHSALTSNDRLAVHYLHGSSVPSEDAARLARMFGRPAQRIVFHEIPDHRIAGLRIEEDFGAAMWYRIFLPELLADLDRVLYLDVDTLILDRLDPLWELELGVSLLAAVRNVFMPYHRHRPRDLGMQAPGYFNSGVLLLNLEQMRNYRFTEAIYALARNRSSELDWPDQDALNLAVGGRWLPLHPRWNVMNSMVFHPELARATLGAAEVDRALAAPAIRHFEGPGFNKPWHAQHERPGRRLYRLHRRATPWPRYSFDGDTRWRRIKRLGGALRG